jgi:hypothetical protein
VPDVAAEIEVPFPLITPVTLVVSVIAGVVVGLATVPAKPFADTTEAELTPPPEELITYGEPEVPVPVSVTFVPAEIFPLRFKYVPVIGVAFHVPVATVPRVVSEV